MPKLSLAGKATRTERLALLTEPKTRNDLGKLATINRTSVNSIVNDAIQEYLNNHRDDIKRYNDFFGEE